MLLHTSPGIDHHLNSQKFPSTHLDGSLKPAPALKLEYLPNIQPRTMDYRKTFFESYPEFDQDGEMAQFVEVHHAIPQVVLTKYPGLFTSGEMHSINNLRGICRPWKQYVHQEITQTWNEWLRRHPQKPTRQEVIDEAARIDQIYGKDGLTPAK